MQGWDLDWLVSLAVARICDTDEVDRFERLRSHFLFPMDYHKWHGPAYRYTDDLEAWKLTVPPSAQHRGALFNALDLITRYQLADLYVDVSSVEGWGLPPLEAVACGTPAISVQDSHVRSEIHARYCNHMIDPYAWDTWHTGARLQLVDPRDVASVILCVKNDYEREKEFAIEKAASVMADLPWRRTADRFVDFIRRAYGQRT